MNRLEGIGLSLPDSAPRAQGQGQRRGRGLGRGRRRLLDDIRLDLPAGTVTWVVGRSGAGKSLLLDALVGLAPLGSRTRGTVRLTEGDQEQRAKGARLGSSTRPASGARLGTRAGDRTLRRWREEGRIAWAPQNPADTFVPGRSAREVLRVAGREVPDLSPFLLEDGMLDRDPASLSGGQAARLSLALACAWEPELLVADEPTAGLDAPAADVVVGLLRARASRGSAVLAATHDLSALRRLRSPGPEPVSGGVEPSTQDDGPRDRIAVIDEGRLLTVCTLGTFLAGRAEDPLARALARAVPDPERTSTEEVADAPR